MKRFSLAFLVFIYACTPDDKPANQKKTYFDLAEFIQQKITQLTDNQPITRKKVSINGKQELIKSNKINWQKELELFNEADINKQAFLTSYEKVETPYSLLYTLKKGEDLPVKRLNIALDSLSKMPRLIEANIKTKNYLYESAKNLQMTLQQGNLKNYRIESSQELFWGSKKTFLIEGNLD